MDYRGRKYYLIQVPYKYMNDIVALIKGTIKYSKVHHLENNKNDPAWSSKILVSCNYIDYETLENLLYSLQKIVSRRYNLFFYCGRTKVSLQFREITKEELGQ